MEDIERVAFSIQLTDNSSIVGFLPEAEIPQLFHKIFIHLTHN